MDVIQVSSVLDKAAVTYIEASQEYCLFFGWKIFNNWPTCMTKSEWASWVQAIAVILTISVTFLLFIAARRSKRKVLRSRIDNFRRSLEGAKGYLSNRVSEGGVPLSWRESLLMSRSCLQNINDSKDFMTGISSIFGDVYTRKVFDFFRAVNNAENDVDGFLGIEGKSGPSTEILKKFQPEDLLEVEPKILKGHLNVISIQLEEIKKIPRILFVF